MKLNSDENGGVATLEKPAAHPSRPKSAPLQERRQKPVHKPVHTDWGDEEEAPTGFKKWRAPLIVAVLTIAGIWWAAKTFSKADGRGSKKDNVAMVQLHLPPAPPPPPPPPPPPETMKEEKMIENEKEEEAPPDPTPVVDTALKGPGAGPIPVAAGNRGFFGNRNTGLSVKARWNAYAGQVQARIADALRNHRRMRNANFRLEVRIWPDNAGRITRAQLAGSTGDRAVDAALKDEVLTGLQLQEPPPQGMPMPIVLRVSARRPS